MDIEAVELERMREKFIFAMSQCRYRDDLISLLRNEGSDLAIEAAKEMENMQIALEAFARVSEFQSKVAEDLMAQRNGH